MGEETLKGQTVRGTMWSVLERFSVQGVGFLVMIVMARVLTPDDYGLVGELTVFVAVAQSLVDSGFSQALIRKQGRTQTDNSTVFYFNIVVGALLYGGMFLAAPAIARFYNEPLLVPLTRVIAVSMVFNSAVVVQRALLTDALDFRTQAKASLAAAVASGVVGVGMAYSGMGVWSLAGYQLVNLGVNAGLLWGFSPWRPSWLFSWRSFRELFAFGSKLAASGVLETVYQNCYLLVIGKFFRASDLGYYTRAHQFAQFPSSNVTGILQRVTFPVMCRIQDKEERLREVYVKFLRVSAFVIFPLMAGLAAVAVPLVVVVLKERWEFAGVLLEILCFAMMWYPIHALNLNLLQVKGRSDLFLKLEIIKKVIGVAVLCLTLPLGLEAMCWGLVANSLIALTINTRYTGRLIGLGFFAQMRHLCPSLLYSLSMWGLIWAVTLALPSAWLKLVVGITVGAAYFLCVCRLTHSRELRELLALLKHRG